MATSEETKFNELKAKLLRQIGSPTSAQYTDDQANDALDSAIKEFSKQKPIQVLDYLTTVKDQPTYDLSAKDRIMKVKEVFYQTGSEYMPEEFWPDTVMLGRLEGLSLFENPSLWTQYMQRLEQYSRIFDGDFEYDESSKILRLIPVPSTARMMYYIWTKRHTALTIPEDNIDTMLLWAKGEAFEVIAARRDYQIRSVSGYGESVTLGSSPESLVSKANDYKDRFRRKFGGSVISVG